MTEETKGRRASGHAELASFAYATSRSGKTTYYSPVIVRKDLSDGGRERAVIQSFLFLPTEGEPFGTLNPPYSVYTDRLGDPDLVTWGVWPPELRRLLEELVAEVNDPAHLKGADSCRACGAPWVEHTMGHAEHCTYIRATDGCEEETA